MLYLFGMLKMFEILDQYGSLRLAVRTFVCRLTVHCGMQFGALELLDKLEFQLFIFYKVSYCGV